MFIIENGLIALSHLPFIPVSILIFLSHFELCVYQLYFTLIVVELDELLPVKVEELLRKSW